MACSNSCTLCGRLVVSDSVTFTDGNLNIDIPTAVYTNGEKYCIIIAQAIPTTTTITAPVYITIGGAGSYPVIDKCCRPVSASEISTRTRYAMRVITTSTGGSFKILCNVDPPPVLPSLP